MEEISQLALVVVFAAVLLVGGQLFMEYRASVGGPTVATLTSNTRRRDSSMLRQFSNEKPRLLALHISNSSAAGATRLKCRAIQPSTVSGRGRSPCSKAAAATGRLESIGPKRPQWDSGGP
jgi:hypothetical protein